VEIDVKKFVFGLVAVAIAVASALGSVHSHAVLAMNWVPPL
jgi:hypothetical protein